MTKPMNTHELRYPMTLFTAFVWNVICTLLRRVVNNETIINSTIRMAILSRQLRKRLDPKTLFQVYTKMILIRMLKI